jgi:hypothetical protein
MLPALPYCRPFMLEPNHRMSDWLPQERDILSDQQQADGQHFDAYNRQKPKQAT